MDQQQLMQLQMIEQEAENLNKQVELIDQNISEMGELKESLDEIESNNNKEILANLGKKIFIPVEIKDKNLIVEVGNKTFIKKSIPETKKVIDEQLKKLIGGRSQIVERVEMLQSDMEGIMHEIEKKDSGHKHGPDCKHD